MITFDPGGWLGWIVAGLLAGWLAGHLTRGRGFGCLGDILLGVIGAFVAGFILSFAAPQLAGGVYGFWGTLVVAFLGAFALAIIGRLLFGRGRPRQMEWNGQRRRLQD
ncbi:MAG TPA: GlsB/YeaQ/YmgE family stress response membrane protein [Ktedonobacterales bacterium]|nr:GlsB/YeaQ/YmgE family stress response membrane protein [Ktedonobacterales bacterium]